MTNLCAVSVSEQQQGGIFVNSKKTYELVIAAIFIALIAVLSLTPIGFLTLGVVAITFVHIPVIIGSITLHHRFYYGIIFGLAFGICSFLRALTSASVFEKFVFTDPRIAVIPRIVVGLAAVFVFRGISKIIKRKEIAYGLTAVAATLTNTVTVVGSVFIFHSEEVRTLIGMDAAAWFFATILSVNVVLEVTAAVVISVPVCMAVEKASKQFAD